MSANQNRRLISLFESLSITDKSSLLSFAEFLASRNSAADVSAAAIPTPAEPKPVPEPEALPRPNNETVVAAVKRLSKSYFMLDKRDMLGVTSDLMTQHIVQGREAAAVIDELEALFREHYRQLVEGKD